MKTQEVLPHLPEEVWRHIFSYIKPREKNIIALVCKYWKQIVRDEYFHKNAGKLIINFASFEKEFKWTESWTNLRILDLKIVDLEWLNPKLLQGGNLEKLIIRRSKIFWGFGRKLTLQSNLYFFEQEDLENLQPKNAKPINLKISFKRKDMFWKLMKLEDKSKDPDFFKSIEKLTLDWEEELFFDRDSVEKEEETMLKHCFAMVQDHAENLKKVEHICQRDTFDAKNSDLFVPCMKVEEEVIKMTSLHPNVLFGIHAKEYDYSSSRFAETRLKMMKEAPQKLILKNLMLVQSRFKPISFPSTKELFLKDCHLEFHTFGQYYFELFPNLEKIHIHGLSDHYIESDSLLSTGDLEKLLRAFTHLKRLKSFKLIMSVFNFGVCTYGEPSWPITDEMKAIMRDEFPLGCEVEVYVQNLVQVDEIGQKKQ